MKYIKEIKKKKFKTILDNPDKYINIVPVIR